MGQKVNPIGLRLILNKKWQSRWYAGKKEFGSFLQEDLKIRAYLEKKLKNESFLKNAPALVISKEKDKLSAMLSKLEKLKERIAELC